MFFFIVYLQKSLFSFQGAIGACTWCVISIFFENLNNLILTEFWRFENVFEFQKVR
jgi:hypothetical protein